MRVGKRTDFDKITLEILTDGSITPTDAFQKSVAILVDQFQSLQVGSDKKEEVAEVEAAVVEEEAPKKEKAHRKKKATEEVEA